MTRMSKDIRYKRVLLKLSGEGLVGERGFGIDLAVVERIAGEVGAAVKLGAQIALVVGGGNIFRGMAGAVKGMDRANADYMGMLATVLNGLALEGALERCGVSARLLSAIPMPTICEPYIRSKALSHLEKGHAVICAGGTGNPFFTTDTAAALRAAELDCDGLFKATNVDGVYSADPKREPEAKRFDRLTYRDVLEGDLKVMDAAAIALARENGIPIIVFSVQTEGGIVQALQGKGRSTLVAG